jgi:hypothetical protein
MVETETVARLREMTNTEYRIHMYENILEVLELQIAAWIILCTWKHGLV